MGNTYGHICLGRAHTSKYSAKRKKTNKQINNSDSVHTLYIKSTDVFEENVKEKVTKGQGHTQLYSTTRHWVTSTPGLEKSTCMLIMVSESSGMTSKK